MKQKFKSVKEKMNKLFQKFAPVKEKAEVFLSKLPKRKPHSEKYYKRITVSNYMYFVLICQQSNFAIFYYVDLSKILW